MQTTSLRNGLTRAARASFRNLPNWDNPDQLAVPMSRLSTRAQVTQARLLTSMASVMDGSPVRVDMASVTGDAIRDGDIEAAWRVPMYALWGNLSSGMDQAELIRQGDNDVQTQAITDLSFSQRETMSRITGDQSNGIIGYWRVPAEGSACDFCVTIADRLYFIEDLMPVHPGCTCSVEPAFRSDLGGESVAAAAEAGE